MVITSVLWLSHRGGLINEKKPSPTPAADSTTTARSMRKYNICRGPWNVFVVIPILLLTMALLFSPASATPELAASLDMAAVVPFSAAGVGLAGSLGATAVSSLTSSLSKQAREMWTNRTKKQVCTIVFSFSPILISLYSHAQVNPPQTQQSRNYFDMAYYATAAFACPIPGCNHLYDYVIKLYFHVTLHHVDHAEYNSEINNMLTYLGFPNPISPASARAEAWEKLKPSPNLIFNSDCDNLIITCADIRKFADIPCCSFCAKKGVLSVLLQGCNANW